MVNRKNIGIITFHNDINYGAFLQAYALQKYISGTGHKCFVFNYRNLVYTLKQYKVLLKTKNPKLLYDNVLKIINFKKTYKCLERTRRIFSCNSLSRVQCDLLVVGSDSVWNYTNKLCGFDPVYFGKGVNCKKKIAYAPSFGPDVYEDARPLLISKLLKTFDDISVRDNNSKRIVEKLVKSNVNVVLDPVFLYDFRSEIRAPLFKDYILVYSSKLKVEELKIVKELSKLKKKKVISVGYRNEGCDINIPSVSPFEWLGFIKNSDFVFTSMYHGILFSVKFNKQFLVFYSKYRSNKIIDFLSQTNLNNRLIKNDTDINKQFMDRINYAQVRRTINNKYNISQKYLGKYISNVKQNKDKDDM